MPIHRRHSLAGTCGIPAMDDRIYIQVDTASTDIAPGMVGTRPERIHWADGRSWEVEGVFGKQEFGREIYGNLCIRWTLGIRRQMKTVWQDDTGWFVSKKQ